MKINEELFTQTKALDFLTVAQTKNTHVLDSPQIVRHEKDFLISQTNNIKGGNINDSLEILRNNP